MVRLESEFVIIGQGENECAIAWILVCAVVACLVPNQRSVPADLFAEFCLNESNCIWVQITLFVEDVCVELIL
jgi:hypothetical protein